MYATWRRQDQAVRCAAIEVQLKVKLVNQCFCSAAGEFEEFSPWPLRQIFACDFSNTCCSHMVAFKSGTKYSARVCKQQNWQVLIFVQCPPNLVYACLWYLAVALYNWNKHNCSQQYLSTCTRRNDEWVVALFLWIIFRWPSFVLEGTTSTQYIKSFVHNAESIFMSSFSWKVNIHSGRANSTWAERNPLKDFCVFLRKSFK